MATVEMAVSALMAVVVADTKERKVQDNVKLAEFLKSSFRDEV
jgi:hypothetical protein